MGKRTVYITLDMRVGTRQEALAMLVQIADRIVRGDARGEQDPEITSGWYRFAAMDCVDDVVQVTNYHEQQRRAAEIMRKMPNGGAEE